MKYKHLLLIAAVCVTMFTGCSTQQDTADVPAKQEVVDHISAKKFADFGGCASLKMPGNLATAAATDSSYEKAENITSFYGTSEQAWKRLLDGKQDVIFAYEPSDEIKKQLEEQKICWQKVGTDALVMLAGGTTQSPTLTKEQIVSAYSDKKNAWTGYSSVSGSDSRILFENLCANGDSSVILGESVMENGAALTACCPHTPGTLCYTTYLSIHEHGQPMNTTMVAVNGVLPSEQTLTSVNTDTKPAYSFQVPYYIACRGDLKINDSAKVFYDWMTSEEGMKWLYQATLAYPTTDMLEMSTSSETNAN